MAELEIIPGKPCAKADADCAKAHAMPLWLMKSDGSIVNAADALCCILEAMGETKHISHIPGCDENGEPALLVVTTICADDGTTTTTTETIPMSANFDAGTGPDMEWDKEDIDPFVIAGPAAAAPVSDIIADALAATTQTTFTIEGSDITPDDILECGSVSIATMDGKRGIVINGNTDFPVASWNDLDGVNGNVEIEILEGCTVMVTPCARKKYIPAKV